MLRDKHLLLFLLIWLLAACGGENTAPDAAPTTEAATTAATAVPAPTETAVPPEPVDSSPIRDVANVDTITVNIAATSPVEVSVTASGNLPDGCTTLAGSEQVMLDEVIFVRIFTERPANQDCTQALVPFSETFPIDVTGLGAGEHPLNVNGVFGTVVLPADTLAADDPALVCPAGTADLTPLVNSDDGYCLLYPLGFEVAPAPGVVTITVPAMVTEEDPEPVTAALTIERLAAPAGGDAAALAADRLPPETATEEIMLGSETAVVATTTARDLPARQLFVVHDEAAFVLTLTPTDANAYPDAALDAELFWETAVDSFTFLP